MRRAGLRVGLLLLGGLALLSGLVLFLSGNPFRSTRLYESYFRESVQGLEVGAAVKYLGVTLGHVTEIGLTSAAYGAAVPAGDSVAPFKLVYVRFVIDPARVGRMPDAEAAVRQGLRARLAAQGITGLSFLELNFANAAEYPPVKVPWTPEGIYIPSMPSTLGQMETGAASLLEKLEKVNVVALAQAAQHLLEDLHTAFGNRDLRETLTRTAATLDTLDLAVRKADLPKLMGDLRGTLAATDSLTRDPRLKLLLADAARTAERLSAVSVKLPPLIASLQNTARRANDTTAEAEASLAPILRDARATLGNLRETTAALRRDPAGVLLAAPPPRLPQDRP